MYKQPEHNADNCWLRRFGVTREGEAVWSASTPLGYGVLIRVKAKTRERAMLRYKLLYNLIKPAYCHRGLNICLPNRPKPKAPENITWNKR